MIKKIILIGNMPKIDKIKEKALYEANGNKIYYFDFVQALKNVGINEGDIVFVHSDIFFGKLLVLDRDFLLQTLIDAIKEVVGKNGTIIMPTFSYSIGENKIFDAKNTKSTVGVLTEYFRKQKGVIRTIEPMLSVAIWGQNKKFLSNIGQDSFGRGSIFDKLYKLKGKIVFFGTQTCTFLHYIEKMHGVPYRFEKKFKGKIRNKGKIYKTDLIYFARRLNQKNTSYFSIAIRDLSKKGLFKKSKLGKSAIASVKSDVLFKEVFNRLDRNPRYYLKSNLSSEEEKKLI